MHFSPLQAFIDDSGSDTTGDAFLLGGYIAPTDKWERFSEEWLSLLARPPGAAYFKTVEAVNLRGEFRRDRGWTKDLRDTLLVELAHTIWRYCTTSISASIRHSDWAETIKMLSPVNGKRTVAHDHPYVFLWHRMLTELWLHPTKLGLHSRPCEFVFDQQIGFDVHALRFWETVSAVMASSERLPEGMANWIISPPTFQDEKVAIPLQAADFFAWANRRAIACDPTDLKLPPEAIERLAVVPAMHMTISREYLAGQTARASQLMQHFAPQ